VNILKEWQKMLSERVLHYGPQAKRKNCCALDVLFFALGKEQDFW
jgi:hypothetical protein